MVRQAALPGTLLKMERMRQERGQKEVCYGVCVPSYLSKIEHGLVQPDPGILKKLFTKLGITWEADESVLGPCREQMEAYFYRMEYRLDTEEIYRTLAKKGGMLCYSPLTIDWLLIEGFELVYGNRKEGVSASHKADNPVSLLASLKESMDSRQAAYYKLLLYWEDMKSPEGVRLCREASETLGSSFAMNVLCFAYIQQGEYSAIHQMENRVVAAALEEGNTYQLANYYFYKGTAYACLNLEDMMTVYYERNIRLLQNTAWKSELCDVYYNLGASYVSLKRYEKALEYLEKVEAQGQEYSAVSHKKALALIRSGRKEEARKFLEKMKNQLLTDPGSSEADYLKYEEACMECREEFLDAPEYLDLLERLMEALRREYHFGHLYFYRDVMVEACKRQRKYKKALEFEQEISSKTLKRDI